MAKTKCFAALILLLLGSKIFSQNANADFSGGTENSNVLADNNLNQFNSTNQNKTGGTLNTTASGANGTSIEISNETGSESNQEEILEEYSEQKVKEGWQILNWEEDDEAVSRFDVEIQEYNSEDKTWSTVQFIKLKDNSTSVKLEPRLKPGNYRYRFIPYNFFGLKEHETEYEYFTIRSSFQPEIRSVIVNLNMSSTIYFDEINDGIISASGRNLFVPPESENDISFTEYFLQGQSRKNFRYFPELLNLGENGRTAEFYLDLRKLDVGNYYLVARDASGLESEKSNRNLLQIKFKKEVDFNISVGYSVPLILFDDTFNIYFSSSSYPISAAAKLSFLPFKRNFGYFGFGISGTYTRMNRQTENYLLDGNFITGHLNFVYELPLKVLDRKLRQNRHFATLELHGGIGGTYFCNYKFHFPHDIETEPLNSLNFSFLAGLSFQFYFWRRLFVELNFDYVQSFISDMDFGIFIPSLNFGWQF